MAKRNSAVLRWTEETERRRVLEFAALHGEFVAMRRSRVWRLARALGNDLARARRFFSTVGMGTKRKGS